MTDFDPDGRAEEDSGIFGLGSTPEDAAVVLVPAPFDAATSWGRGCNEAPEAIVTASHQLDLYDPVVGTPYEHGIAMLEDHDRIAAINQRACEASARARAADSAALEEANALAGDVHERLYRRVRKWLDAGRVVGTVGGDHSCAFGAVRAHLERFPDLGLLQIDAHADLRFAYDGLTWSHASVMRNLLERTDLTRLVQVGLRDVSPGEVEYGRRAGERVRMHFDHEMAAAVLGGASFAEAVASIVDELPERVYISFDIDGLDASLCPHTGTPVPGGLSFQQACALLAAVTDSGRSVVGFDLTEVAPGPPPHERSWDAVVAAHLVYRLSGHGLFGRLA
jgi:agmatinase